MENKINLYGKEHAFYPDYRRYIDGYITAANSVKKALEDQKSYNDYEYYPLIYLHTHILELTLKNILYTYRSFNGEANGKLTHELQKIWDKSKPILEKFKSRIKNEDISKINDLMRCYKGIKNHNEVFRYPDRETPIEEEIEVTPLIKKISTNELQELNYKLLDIGDLLLQLKDFNFKEEHIGFLEEIGLKKPCISWQLLKEEFGERCDKALLILKEHYSERKGYRLIYEKETEHKTHYISIQKIEEIILLCKQRRARRESIDKELKNYPGSNVDKTLVIGRDPKLQEFEKKLKLELSILNQNEIEDLINLMELGRGDLTISSYLQSGNCKKNKITNEKKERDIEYLLDKPLDEYLTKGLSIL